MQIITIFFSAILFFTGIFAVVIFAISLKNIWSRAVHPWQGLLVMFAGIFLFLISLVTASVATNKMSENIRGLQVNKNSVFTTKSQNPVKSSSSSKSINPDNLYAN